MGAGPGTTARAGGPGSGAGGLARPALLHPGIANSVGRAVTGSGSQQAPEWLQTSGCANTDISQSCNTVLSASL